MLQVVTCICFLITSKEKTHLHCLLQAKDQQFIPDGFRIKSPIQGLRPRKFYEKQVEQ